MKATERLEMKYFTLLGLLLLASCGNPFFESEKAQQCAQWLCDEREAELTQFEIWKCTVGYLCTTNLSEKYLNLPATKIENLTEKRFNGRYNEQMPQLIAEGYQPMTMQDVAQARLEGRYIDIFVDTSDAIAYSGDGKFKIIRDSEILHSINEDRMLVNGAILLTPVQYKKIEGVEFDSSKLKINELLTKEEVLAHPVWNALYPDKELLKRYADFVFDKLGGKNMGFYIHEEKLSLRALYLNGVGVVRRSGADDRDRLEGDDARLVGVRRSGEENYVTNAKINDTISIYGGLLSVDYCASHPEDRENCECDKIYCAYDSPVAGITGGIITTIQVNFVMKAFECDKQGYFETSRDERMNLTLLNSVCTHAVPKEITNVKNIDEKFADLRQQLDSFDKHTLQIPNIVKTTLDDYCTIHPTDTKNCDCSRWYCSLKTVNAPYLYWTNDTCHLGGTKYCATADPKVTL